MRTVTMRDLDAFAKANQEVGSEARWRGKTVMTALAVSLGAREAGDADGALSIALAGAIASTDGFDKVLQRFERAAFNFLGERVAHGESLTAYHERLSNLEIDELISMQRRNGILFKR